MAETIALLKQNHPKSKKRKVKEKHSQIESNELNHSIEVTTDIEQPPIEQLQFELCTPNKPPHPELSPPKISSDSDPTKQIKANPKKAKNKTKKTQTTNKFNQPIQIERPPSHTNHPYLTAALSKPTPQEQEKKTTQIVISKFKQPNKMNQPPAKRIKTTDYSFCVSVYFASDIEESTVDTIINLIQNHHSHWYIPANKKHVLQIVCDNHESFTNTMTILNSDSSHNACQGNKYMATPMNFTPTEHTLKFHTQSQTEMLSHTLLLISNFWNKTNGIKEMNMSYDRVYTTYKFKIALNSFQDKDYFVNRGYTEFRSIDQIINESQLACSCNFPSTFKEEDVKSTIKKMFTKLRINFKDNQLEIIQKTSPFKPEDHYFIANYKATNANELELLTKSKVVVVSPKGYIIGKQFKSTAKYLTDKFKNQKSNEGPSNMNNDNPAIETKMKHDLQETMEKQKSIVEMLLDHEVQLKDIFQQLDTMSQDLTDIKNYIYISNIEEDDDDDNQNHNNADEEMIDEDENDRRGTPLTNQKL